MATGSVELKPQRSSSKPALIEERLWEVRKALAGLVDVCTELEEGVVTQHEAREMPPPRPLSALLDALPGELGSVAADISGLVRRFREMLLKGEV